LTRKLSVSCVFRAPLHSVVQGDSAENQFPLIRSPVKSLGTGHCQLPPAISACVQATRVPVPASRSVHDLYTSIVTANQHITFLCSGDGAEYQFLLKGHEGPRSTTSSLHHRNQLTPNPCAQVTQSTSSCSRATRTCGKTSA
jgi:hypothetical protein